MKNICLTGYKIYKSLDRRTIMKYALKFVMLMLIPVFIAGCASTITAISGGETGIPYYLPKPYLLITKNLTPLVEKTIEKKDEKGNTTAIEHTVEPVTTNIKEKDSYSFQIIYLPDLTQKYGLEIHSRTGTIKTNVTLINGWKFVGLNLDADAKTSEIIQSIGSAITSVISPLENLEKGLAPPVELKEKKVGLWLYEIKVENGQLKYDLVIQWPPK